MNDKCGCGEECGCKVALLDVGNSNLKDLFKATDDSALGRSIRRLVKSLDDPNGVISAFSNFV